MAVCPQCKRRFRKAASAQKFCSRECGSASRVIERPTKEAIIVNVWMSDLPVADRMGGMITAAGESLGIGYDIAY